jgi:magnesium transporter
MGNFQKRIFSFPNFEWIDIQNPNEHEIKELKKEYHLDGFHIDDSIERGHLPKVEVSNGNHFVILRAFTGKKNENLSTIEEISNKIAFFFDEKRLITIHRASFHFLNYQEKDAYQSLTVYDFVIQLFSSIIDTYSEPALWQGNQIDEIEKIIFLKDYSNISLEDLYFQKAEARVSKKLLLISQDVLKEIKFPETYSPAIENIQDNLKKLILEYDEALEDAHNLMHTFMSVAAQKNNDVVKLLTVFSAFFLPLTFIVGLYGMNFKYMPELEWRYGYFMVIFSMIIMSVFIYIWFKVKKIL